MYSLNVEKALKSAGISAGDRVSVASAGAEYSGILMPRIGIGDQNCLVVKLDNGYNIGVEFRPGTEIRLLEKLKPQAKQHEPAEKHGKDFVTILGCGGTIASKVEYKTGAVAPAETQHELISSFPQLKSMGSFRSRVLFSLLSEDMSPKHWEIIATEAANEIKDGAEGVILTHGTDTMAYTSAALSFMLRNPPVPVVLTGSQRSSDRGSTDAEMNMVAAALLSRSDIAETGVCMHGSPSDDFCYFHLGTKVRKMHTSRRDAFQSVNAMPIAKVDYATRRIEPLSGYTKRDSKRKLDLDTKMNDNVALIWVHPGIKPSFIEKLGDYDGIVLAGTGLGHAPTNPFNDKYAQSTVPAIKSLVERGIPVVMAPQCIYGRINMNVYTAGRLLLEAGVIGDGADWLPETAFVKLKWVLAKTKDMKKVKELMYTNFAGELSERSLLL